MDFRPHIQKAMAKLKVEEEVTLRNFNRQIAECEVEAQEEVQEATEEKDEKVKTSWTDTKE